jgi:hypothetical protein
MDPWLLVQHRKKNKQGLRKTDPARTIMRVLRAVSCAEDEEAGAEIADLDALEQDASRLKRILSGFKACSGATAPTYTA